MFLISGNLSKIVNGYATKCCQNINVHVSPMLPREAIIKTPPNLLDILKVSHPGI